MENAKKDIRLKLGGRELIISGIIYRFNACLHYLYTHTLFVKLVKLFEILWDEMNIKQYIINMTTILHARVSI